MCVNVGKISERFFTRRNFNRPIDVSIERKMTVEFGLVEHFASSRSILPATVEKAKEEKRSAAYVRTYVINACETQRRNNTYLHFLVVRMFDDLIYISNSKHV